MVHIGETDNRFRHKGFKDKVHIEKRILAQCDDSMTDICLDSTTFYPVVETISQIQRQHRIDHYANQQIRRLKANTAKEMRKHIRKLGKVRAKQLGLI